MKLVVVIALLVACKKSEPAKHTGSCNTPATKICEDYSSTEKRYVTGKQGECKTAGGAWAAEPCATADVLGTCEERTATWTRARHYYVGGTTVIDKTKVECGAYGKWIDPPSPQ